MCKQTRPDFVLAVFAAAIDECQTECNQEATYISNWGRTRCMPIERWLLTAAVCTVDVLDLVVAGDVSSRQLDASIYSLACNQCTRPAPGPFLLNNVIFI